MDQRPDDRFHQTNQGSLSTVNVKIREDEMSVRKHRHFLCGGVSPRMNAGLGVHPLQAAPELCYRVQFHRKEADHFL